MTRLLPSERTTRQQCRVMVADDHPGISTALRQLLVSYHFDVVGSIEDGARVLEEAARLRDQINDLRKLAFGPEREGGRRARA